MYLPKFYKYCLLVLLFTVKFTFSQNVEIELRNSIETTKDSALVKAYLDLAKYYYQTTGKGDSLVFYAEKALELSKVLKDTLLEIEALKYKGVGNLVNQDFNRAEAYFKKGLEKVSYINDIPKKADFHNKIGTLHQNQNNFFIAIQHFLEAAKFSNQIKDYRAEANAYYGISLVYTAQREYEKQLDYISKAVDVLENNDINDSLLETLIYNYAAEQYMEASKNNKYPAQANLAKKYAEKAFLIADQNDFDYTKPVSLGVLSEFNFLNKNYSKAAYYSNKVLKKRDLITEPLILNSYCVLGRVNKVRNNKKKALAYIDSLNHLKIKSDAYYAVEISNLKHEIYKYFNNPNLALSALEEKEQFVKELNDKERIKSINELETRYETELKDAEIKSLSQQKRIDALEIQNKQAQIKKLTVLLVIASLVIVSILLIGSMVRLKRTQRKNQELKLAIEKQLQLEKELSEVRDEIAQDFHDDLGNKLARISLLSNLISGEASIKNPKVKSKIKQINEDANGLYRGTRDFIFSLKSNSDYLEEVITYLSDFGSDIFKKSEVKFIVEKHISDNVKLPHYWNKQLIFIFKEALTNALKHSKSKTVKLSFDYNNNELSIKCEDEGVGVLESDFESLNGLSHMKTRAQKIGCELFIDSNIGKGTTVRFIGNLEKSSI
ncbi:hypothetical protein H7U19_13830 [Hyunsoonleella sp. SJ7]|uniref:histidine kinase n=1 Tax=Hyunsoonleella aquatilis TaxID=2762758 RepID=A0A923HHN5_9FLAO|nr:histidine kinase [Hyunsoonleella aquatilis]MBC3759495.1 hypothetical protein [Hyunsoonleella aquatilis]